MKYQHGLTYKRARVDIKRGILKRCILKHGILQQGVLK